MSRVKGGGSLRRNLGNSVRKRERSAEKNKIQRGGRKKKPGVGEKKGTIRLVQKPV